MLEPLVSTIEVGCDQKTAFTIFVEQMGEWWPLTKRSMSMHSGQVPRGLLTEPRAGGRIVELGHDGVEHHWGTFRDFDPHDFISIDFHMGLAPENASLVGVRFIPLNAGRTQVELVQSNFEAFGDMAEMMRRGYGSGWRLIFEEGFRAACDGKSRDPG